MVIDGQATVIAYLTPGGDEVRDAFVTENPLLSMVMHYGVVGESLFGDLTQRVGEGQDARVVADELIAIARTMEPSTLTGRARLRSLGDDLARG